MADKWGGHWASHWALHWSGSAVAPPAPGAVIGGGPPLPAKGKRRRHYIEVDHELFEVRDERHALEILGQLRELAEENAERIAAVVTQPDTKPAPDVLTSLPQITTNFAQIDEQIRETRAMIAALYDAAMRGEQYFREWQGRIFADQDEDDAITMLLL